MEHRRLFDDAWSYNPNLRAEDGSRIPDRTSTFREFILIPIGFLFATLLLILLITCSAFGQAGSGRIAGSVKDATGAVIPGSSVTLRNTATGVTQATTSNEEGIFSFPVVSIGQYELDVTANGFNPYRQTTNLKVDVNTALTLDVILHVVDTSDTVTVTENRRRFRPRTLRSARRSRASRSSTSRSTAAATPTCLPCKRVSRP
jgi:Carboxypeptidase regulatory-like domain